MVGNCKNIVSFQNYWWKHRDFPAKSDDMTELHDSVIISSKFVTETSFDFLGICDIIYHAEENGRKADRTEVSQWQRETAQS